ncbi:AraC family transcriptional regulator [Paenibacillus oceani]|uniref:Helix-turn-helix transcriptional regulator n=1 Tax=Paenibacillus oceani TaxID=2772510 RepID=A0A927C5S1_9BACL|nr:AraC family transcriptional regulator [Paenibacillus oceani]MBD2860633.1 helix-turn-helix transcriptional regulator [Paenibacillus oceani]
MLWTENPIEWYHTWRYVPDAFDKLGGLWPLHLGHNIAKSHYTNGPRQTTYADIHVVMEGRVRFQHGDQTVVLDAGDLFCKYPDTPYTYAAEPSDVPLRMIWLAFDGPQVWPLLGMIGFAPERPYQRQSVDQECSILLQQMVRWSHGEATERMMMYSWMYRLFHKLIPVRHSGSVADWVQRGIDYMQANFMESIGVSDVADYIGVHRTYLTRLFTKAIGMPPTAYLCKLRMEQAMYYLRETQLTVTAIAHSVGYPDIYTFTRAFSRYYGMSPRHFKTYNHN